MAGQPTIKVWEDAAGEWRWKCIAANGEEVDHGEGHRDATDAVRAANDAARNIELAITTASIEILDHPPDE